MNNTTKTTKQSAAALTDRRRNLIFLNIVISCIASSLLSTALTTALPSIMEDLSISAVQILADGHAIESIGGVPASMPLEPDWTLLES